MLAIQAVLDVRPHFGFYILVFLTRRCLLPLAGMPSECTSDGRKVSSGSCCKWCDVGTRGHLTGLIFLVVVTHTAAVWLGDHPLPLFFLFWPFLPWPASLLMLLDDSGAFPETQIYSRCRKTHRYKKLFLSPGRALLAVGLGVTGNVLLAVATFFLAQSIGVAVTVLDCLVLMPPVILITTIPISIAGWGVREVRWSRFLFH